MEAIEELIGLVLVANGHYRQIKLLSVEAEVEGVVH